MFDDNKKRFTPSVSTASNESDNDEDGDEDDVSRTGTGGFNLDNKLPHSLVEKKRRDKMSSLVMKLSAMIPMCSAMNRKLDKITVLRMCVQHLKAIRGSHSTIDNAAMRPAVLTGEDILKVILKNVEGFLFVVACDRGKLLYVSESVQDVLNCSHKDLIGQSLFDLLHQKDVANVKDQLLLSDARKVFVDSKTMEPVNPVMVIAKDHVPEVSSGAARAFYCRMRNSLSSSQQTMITDADDGGGGEQLVSKKRRQVKTFTTLACSGYLKSWASAKVTVAASSSQETACSDGGSFSSVAGGMGSSGVEDEGCNLSCLVAVARVPRVLCPAELAAWQDSASLVAGVPPLEFSVRLTDEGKFLYVDPYVFILTGSLSQNMLGTSFTDYVKEEDVSIFTDMFKDVMLCKEKVTSRPFLFKKTDGTFVPVCCDAWRFVNPWTKEIEYIVCSVRVSLNAPHDEGRYSFSGNVDFWSSREAQRCQGVATATSPQTQSSSASSPMGPVTRPGNGVISEDNNEDDNAEMSMALIMNILEADGGLGGQVDFSDMPWPL